jgi:hypothetical protein
VFTQSTCSVRAALAAAIGMLAPAVCSRAQCVAVPSDTPAFGSPSSAPFGNNNPSDPIFSDLRYQVLVPRALLPAQTVRIGDLQVAPAGSRLRQFLGLTVTMGHNPAGQLGSAMHLNLVGATRTWSTAQWLVPTTANTWNALGLPIDFVFDPALGDLVVEFRVVGGGATAGSGTAGFRTDGALPYVWTPGGGFIGNTFAGGGIKLRLCTDTHGLLELGGGCPGSNGQPPHLSYSGSAQAGGPGLQVQLANAIAVPNAPVVLVWSFGLRALPIDLGLIGAAGCSTHVFGDVTMAALTTGGACAIPFAVPPGPYACLPIWNQWFVLDPAANAIGLTTSNPGRILVGS